MVNYDKLIVRYKYTKTMTIEKNSAQHIFDRWEEEHLKEFYEDGIEFHVSPIYTYNGKHYTQITLDLDLGRVHKREGGTKNQLKDDIDKIKTRLNGIPFHIEFTGNGYRVVSDVAWSDLDLDQARKLAMRYRSELPTIDPVSSFRRMPIARIGTHDKGKRVIVLVNKSDADDFSKYKSISKQHPSKIMSISAWFRIFKKYWFPNSYKSSGGMNVIKKIYNVKE